MRSTGIVRKIDDLGRVVLPAKVRRKFKLEIKDMVEMYVDRDMIILKKYKNKCIFCKETENLKEFKGKNICTKCKKKICSPKNKK